MLIKGYLPGGLKLQLGWLLSRGLLVRDLAQVTPFGPTISFLIDTSTKEK